MIVYTYDLLFIYGIRYSITLVFELELRGHPTLILSKKYKLNCEKTKFNL